MKILKYLLYFIVALVVIGVILGLVGPKSYSLERSVTIATTPDVVWSHMNTLKKVNEWSPFLKADSSAVVTYSGNDGEIGSSSAWESKKMGKGEQTITSLDPMKSSSVHLHFIKPYESESDGYLSLAPEGANTKVTWSMKGNNNFMARAMSVMMNMDKMIGPYFETGLNDLKTLAEAEPKAPKMDMNYTVTTGQYTGKKYLAIRKTMSMKDISDFYMTNVPKLMDAVKSGKGEVTGAPTGLYYTWDEKKMETDMAAAVPLKADMKAPAGMQIINTSDSKALMIDYQGGYAKMGDAHMAMDMYIKANKLEPASPVMEEYLVGPGTEKDSTKWMTKIIYLVK